MLKVTDIFGKQIMMLTACIIDLIQFTFFFFLMILFFMQIFYVIGAAFGENNFALDFNHNTDAYALIREMPVMLFSLFQNSIGNISPPHYYYWEIIYRDGLKMQGSLMIGLIWVVWLIQIYI